MRKKILSILLAACLIFSLLPVSAMADAAESGSCGDNLTWKLENGVLTISGTGDMENYSTASKSDGSGSITTAPWGEYYEAIERVVIENGVMIIGKYAFFGCNEIKSVSISDSVDSIGIEAFGGCSALEMVTLGNGLKAIEEAAFVDCTSLKSIVIPDSVDSIGDYAFAGCSVLETLTLGNGLKAIEIFAFQDCTGLKSIVIPDSVESVGNYAFDGCSGLETVTLSNGLKAIRESVFKNCTNLKSIVIPDSVESIGSDAFAGCSGLETLTLGKGIKTIGKDAFLECVKVTDVYYNGDINSWIGIQFENYASRPCYFSDGDVNLYFGGRLVTSVIIPDGVTSIGDYTFRNYSSLKSVTLPDSVTSIGKAAFDCCTGLEELTLGEGVKTIGSAAFSGCTGLTSIVIPDRVTSIEKYTFSGCRSLTSLEIPNRVKAIGDYAFSGCSNLKSLTIGSGVKSIGRGAFRNCSSLESLVIPDSVTSLDLDLLEGCSGLLSLTIGGGLTSIDGYRFSTCKSLTSLTISNGVKTIEAEAFSSWSNLTNVTLPDSITSIGKNAFANCKIENVYYTGEVDSWLGISMNGETANPCSNYSNLYFNGELATDIVIPDGATKIGYYTFYGCKSLKSVAIPDSITSIGRYAFVHCYNLEDICFSGTKSDWDGMTKKVEGLYGTRIHFNCTAPQIIPTGMKDPSCTSSGYIIYKCMNCGREFISSIDPKHDYVLVKSVATTCAGVGYDEYKCSKCGDVKQEYYNETKPEHSYVFVETVGPTCLLRGYDLYRCSKCGSENKEYTDDELLPHDYVVTVVEPTCLKGGYTTHTCSVCGKTYKDDYTALLGHSMVEVSEKPATCTEAGHTAGVQCSRCGAIESGVTEIPALDHSYGAWKQTIAPSCTAKGTETHSCTRCNAAQTRDVNALGHSYANGKCTRCGAADPNYKPAPKVPELKITTVSGKPKIYWNAVDGAVKYWIYRSTDGKNFKYYDSTTKTSYTNNSTAIGSTYYYKVKAVGANGAKSDYSVSKGILCKPAAPTVSINRSNGKPKLSWKAVSGATKYWIYRSTDGVNFKYFDSTTKTSYTNSGAASGTKYYYRVKAVAYIDGVNVTSANSSTKSLMTSLAKPSVSITTSNGKPKLTWKAVTGADKYYIYRSTDGKNFSYFDSTTKTTYVNSGAKKNTKYYYKVKAVCASNSNANSAQSAAVSIKATK